MRFATKQLPLDMVEEAEAFVQSGRFTDLDRKCVHARFVEMAKSGKGTSDELVQHIYDRQINQFGATAVSLDVFRYQKEHFDQKVWPVIAPLIRSNAGTAQFMLEYGVDSQFVAQFLCDVQQNQGVSILLGHCIGHTVMDDLVLVPQTDNAFAFYHDASFGIFRHRVKLAQEEMRKAKKILFLGGGADPALYVRRYPLGELGQQITMYDNNPQMPKYLEKIVGRLDYAGISYRIANIDDVLQDKALYGQFDLICLLGVAAYYSERSKFLFDGVRKLLMPGGKVIFDLQSTHPVLAFDVLVLGWPTTMHVEKDVATAMQVSQQYCQDSGLKPLWSKAEEVASSGEIPAGVVTLAQKPTD